MNDLYNKVQLQWFAEEAAASKGKDDEQAEGKKADPGAESSEKEDKAKSETVPRATFDKLQSDLENFKRIEEERKGKEKKRQEELLREQGKYKDLYDAAVKEVETMKVQLEKLTLAAKSMLEEEMKELPEDFDKTLIPNIDDYDKTIWLRKAKGIIVKKVEPRKGDGTPPAGGEPLAAMRSIYTNPSSPKH